MSRKKREKSGCGSGYNKRFVPSPNYNLQTANLKNIFNQHPSVQLIRRNILRVYLIFHDRNINELREFHSKTDHITFLIKLQETLKFLNWRESGKHVRIFLKSEGVWTKRAGSWLVADIWLLTLTLSCFFTEPRDCHFCLHGKSETLYSLPCRISQSRE